MKIIIYKFLWFSFSSHRNYILKQNWHKVLYTELTDYYARLREFDETEAYLRHRARVHEREKREKLKKQGKLEEYLREVEESKPKANEAETSSEKAVVDENIEKTLQEYKEWKKQEEPETLKKFDVDDKKVVEMAKLIKRRKVIARRRKEMREETRELLGYDPIEEPPPFKPKMAGRTGMPSFFFSNLVKQNAKAFIEQSSKHKMKSFNIRM